MADRQIQHVSDTALWVAGCRAMETERPDALFRDPLASRLAGDRGRQIARTVPNAKGMQWSVAVRTVVIDELLRSAIASGVDTVLDLGAGLDTRPYRMDLPASLRWIEVDYPSLIEQKEAQVRDEAPACRVERIGLDLSDRDARRELLGRIGASSTAALVLTEGLVPYLSLEEAAELADDLREHAAFRSWVIDYFSPLLLSYVKRRRPRMENAPIRFDPPDWEAFFAEHGWRVKEMRYLGEESRRLHRRVPQPLFVRLMRIFASRSKRREMLRGTGYARLEHVV